MRWAPAWLAGRYFFIFIFSVPYSGSTDHRLFLSFVVRWKNSGTSSDDNPLHLPSYLCDILAFIRFVSYIPKWALFFKKNGRSLPQNLHFNSQKKRTVMHGIFFNLSLYLIWTRILPFIFTINRFVELCPRTIPVFHHHTCDSTRIYTSRLWLCAFWMYIRQVLIIRPKLRSQVQFGQLIAPSRSWTGSRRT